MRTTCLMITFLLFLCQFSYGQQKFKVQIEETDTWRNIYTLVDEKGRVIRQLDTSLYHICLSGDQFGYFAIFGKKGYSGWAAIDANETVLFNVYNTSFGEPTPDQLIENKIRIVGSDDKIGFANHKGEIVIQPQFEIVTSFNKGKAIIGETCKKVPWNEHGDEAGCHHYSIICKTHGYINGKGVVIKKGAYTFEQIVKEIKWQAPED